MHYDFSLCNKKFILAHLDVIVCCKLTKNISVSSYQVTIGSQNMTSTVLSKSILQKLKINGNNICITF